MVKEIRKEIEAVLDDEKKRVEARNRDESKFDVFRTAAEDAGVDWSDVTVSKVDTSKKLLGGLFGGSNSSESGYKKVPAFVTITSKGKDYTFMLQCDYTSSSGWFLGAPPRWPRSRPRR